MKSKVTYGIWLDNRRKLKSEKFPVKIRITHQRQTKYFPILESKFSPLEFTPEVWKIITKGNPRGTLRDIQLEMNSVEDKVKKIVNSITNFTFDKFNDLLIGKKIDLSLTTLETCMKARIAKYKREDRISTSANASSILKSLMLFLDNKDIELSEFTPRKLKEYENWMIKKGKSLATVGIYTRELRVMFNELIVDGVLNNDCYPFGKGKYQPPKGKKIKSAIHKTEVVKILKFEANELNKEAFCRDLWVFSYLSSGMNIKDIALLKYKNINGNFIHFIREKTASKNKTEKIIPVPVTDTTKKSSKNGVILISKIIIYFQSSMAVKLLKIYGERCRT